MRLLLAIGVTAVLLSGCRCDPEDHAHYLAGSRPVECGYAPSDADRAAVTECLDRAIATGGRAFGGWQEDGIDSEVRQYFVVRPDRVYDLHYDGAGPLLTVSPCIGTPVPTETGYWCEGEALEPYTHCD
ncbi:MAG: hypothetical protein JJ863_28150 [Deltaproteobacteria bacterium]|nr:hypothetical protein [Deltaproteobacteria bacterium]